MSFGTWESAYIDTTDVVLEAGCTTGCNGVTGIKVTVIEGGEETVDEIG